MKNVMVDSHISLQLGLLSPQQFIQEQIANRSVNLKISRHQDVEHTFTGSVNYLSIDDCENRYLLSGCSDGSISIHDLLNLSKSTYYTSKCIAKIETKSRYAHDKSVECVTWFPMDSALFISSGDDKKIKLWDTNLLRPIDVIDSKGRVNHHQCSVKSKSLIAVANNTNLVELIDLRTGHSSHELRGHRGSVMSLAWSPRDECLVASAGMEGEAKLWDVRSSSGHLLHFTMNGMKSAHVGLVNGLSFTPDGLHLVTFGADRHVRVWNSSNGKEYPADFGRIKNDSWRNIQMAVSDYIFVPSKGNIQVLDIWDGEEVDSLMGHFNRVTCCILRHPYSELYSGGYDRNVIVWTADDPLDAMPADVPVADQWSSDEFDVEYDDSGGR